MNHLQSEFEQATHNKPWDTSLRGTFIGCLHRCPLYLSYELGCQQPEDVLFTLRNTGCEELTWSRLNDWLPCKVTPT
jgi:hypothetical protein